jgi:hypothetical protein
MLGELTGQPELFVREDVNADELFLVAAAARPTNKATEG